MMHGQKNIKLFSPNYSTILKLTVKPEFFNNISIEEIKF